MLDFVSWVAPSPVFPQNISLSLTTVAHSGQSAVVTAPKANTCHVLPVKTSNMERKEHVVNTDDNDMAQPLAKTVGRPMQLQVAQSQKDRDDKDDKENMCCGSMSFQQA